MFPTTLATATVVTQPRTSLSKSFATVLLCAFVAGFVLAALAPGAPALAPGAPAHAAGKWSGNLIKNGSAEKTDGMPTDFSAVGLKHWKQTVQFTAGKYSGALADPDAYGSRLAKNSRGPGGRGGKYFVGGYHTTSATKGAAVQKIGLRKHERIIRRGATYKLVGWLGGYAGNKDSMKVTLIWRNAKGKKVGKAAVLKPVTLAERDILTPGEPGGEVTMLKKRVNTGKVPKAARTATVKLVAKRGVSGVRGAYADKLSLKIRRR